MASFNDIIYNNIEASINDIEQIVARYPWWCAARLRLFRTKGIKSNQATRLMAMLHPAGAVARHTIDLSKLTTLSHDELIDKFLRLDNYRISAEEGDADDISQVEIDSDDDMVSEELAEIYINQGLYTQAIDTYRKLSLLNSEKSIYFAGLIAQLERKQNQK